MKTEDLAYIGSDPGAVKYGNFINYYSFHSAKERVDSLQKEMFPTPTAKPILCLDIGCNTGELSNELYSYLATIYTKNKIHILGVDIDPILIKRAQEANYDNENITFEVVNIMIDTDRQIIKKYLDFHNKPMFDVTFCFSITMWIHINNGDQGLQEFLKYISEISDTIIIEPQPWNCYRNAQRRVKKTGSTFPLYDKLKIRSNVDAEIENILSKSSHQKVYESNANNNSWKRIIQSYHKTNSDH